MAEATALRNNATDFPVYGLPYTIVFPILDADGDLVTGAAGLDSEISKNGDTFADCTNEATEIATSSGIYYLTLTATEMTTDVVAIIVKTSTAGAKTTVLTLYPRKIPAFFSGTAQAGDASTITLELYTPGGMNDYFNGCLIYITGGTGAGQARIISDFVLSTLVVTVSPNWATNPSSDSTYNIYATNPADEAFYRQAVDWAMATLSGALSANVTQWDGHAVHAHAIEGVPVVTLHRPGGAVATDGGNTASAFKTNLSSSVDDYCARAYLKMTSGACIDQVSKISAYNGTTKVVTLANALTTTPSNTDTFEIVNE
jgi:hypothetical protein